MELFFFFTAVSLYSTTAAQKDLKGHLKSFILPHYFISNSKHIQTNALIFNTELEGDSESRLQKNASQNIFTELKHNTRCIYIMITCMC